MSESPPVLLLGFPPDRLPPDQLAEIRSIAPDMAIVVTDDREEIEALLDRIEIAARRFPRDLIARAPNLRWLQQWGAGADWLLRYPDVVAHPVVITNVSGIHAIPISEHVFAMLLAFARRLPDAIRAQAQHHWLTHRELNERGGVFELAGLTMLVVGVGAIGERIARLGAAMGMRVWGVRRHPQKAATGVERMVGPDQLLDVLPEADIVVITLPHTPETTHLFDARALAAMKRGAYLVNVGRGKVVDEAALVEALRAGQLAGAGLDVFEEEPLPEDSPLWDLPNVIITSHYSGATPYYDQRALAIFIDNLRRYKAGAPLHHVVDKRLGY
jgi:phosphoglycerate dehydrogenase-like enzyme